MRTWAIAVLTLTVAVCALGGEAAAPVAPTALEGLVPANSMALVQVTSFPNLKKAFEQSALATTVKGSRLLNYFYTVAGAAGDFGAVLASGRPADEMRALIGRQVGIVLLDFESPQDVKRLVPIALLVEATDAKKLEKVVTEQLQLFALLRPELGLTTRTQGDTTVHEIPLPAGNALAYCTRDSFLIVGSRHSVNALIAAKGKGIGADPVYQAVRRQLPTTGGLTAFLNIRKLMERSGVAADPAQLQKLRGAGLAEMKAAGLALDFQGSQLRERIYLHTGGPQTGLLKLLTAGAPVAPTTNRFVPADYTMVATMALKDVGLWDRVHNLLVDTMGDAAAANMDIGANMVLQHLGVQIKEGFFDTITDEMFFAFDLKHLGEFAGAGREPKVQELPFIAGAKLRDAVALTETLNRIADNERLWEQGVERKSVKHGDTDIYRFRIPFNTELRPSYAIAENTLLFSLRPEAVAAALDAAKAAAKAAPPAAKPAHGHLHINDARLLTCLLGLVRADVPAGARHLLPELDRVFASLHGHTATLRREPQGIAIAAQSDLGTTGTILAAAVLIDQFNAVVARRVNKDFDTTAAALEKYYTQHKTYPESLNALVPDFMPAVPRDRFAPKRGYGYSRGRPAADGTLPDAWVLTSVGPDKKPDIPVDQFDPPEWHRRGTAPTPDELPGIKAVVYQFRKAEFKDETKNDDEGDLIRMGGKGLGTARAATPRAAKPKAPPKPPDF